MISYNIWTRTPSERERFIIANQNKDLEDDIYPNIVVSGGAKATEFGSGGGGAFEGQTHILEGQDRIFKKVLLFAHAVVT